jgi:hypothetical protein
LLTQLCTAIEVDPPEPASANAKQNDDAFERLVGTAEPDGGTSWGRIDLYKRGGFVHEAKQSPQKGGANEIAGQAELFAASEPTRRGVRGAGKAWELLVLNARRQAEGYARALPVEHGWPPFYPEPIGPCAPALSARRAAPECVRDVLRKPFRHRLCGLRGLARPPC